jgi:sugar lactone lactonase YvrE
MALEDNTPDPFDFADVTNAAINVMYESSAVITGITGPLTATVSTGTAQIRKNGAGNWATSVTVLSGDTLNIRMTSSSSSGTTVAALVIVGTAAVDWQIATVPGGISVCAANADLYITDVDNLRIRRVNAATTIISTIAGNSTGGYSGDGGSAIGAGLMWPMGIGLDSAGNLYIADTYNHRIRKVNSSTGIITTVVGNGTASYSGDGNLAAIATLRYPTAIALDSAGNLYIADSDNHRIRKVNRSTGIITTVAGNGIAGYSGDGDIATGASLSSPTGIVIDRAGNLLIADRGNNRIRKVNIATGIIVTVAGNGTAGFNGDGGMATAAKLNMPQSVAVDSADNLFIADNNRIRKVNAATSIIATVAGTGAIGYSGDGGAATSASLMGPAGIAVDNSGNFYLGDTYNFRVRKVNAASGIITTVAGNGIAGYSGDGGVATNAKLGGNGLASLVNGLYVACGGGQ